jgi:tellurite resistance-related uncharacterized protein
MNTALPAGLTPYKRTQIFNQETLAPALSQNHRTKAGVWGVIHVLEGRLALTTFEPPGEWTLEPSTAAVIQPEQPHKVRALGDVRFFIEFYRATDRG